MRLGYLMPIGEAAPNAAAPDIGHLAKMLLNEPSSGALLCYGTVAPRASPPVTARQSEMASFQDAAIVYRAAPRHRRGYCSRPEYRLASELIRVL